MVSKDEQIKEAIYRMGKLKIMTDVIRKFAEDGEVLQSERTIIGSGIMYDLDDEIKEKVAKFESKFKSVVYHVIMSNTEFGRMWALLYVSSSKDEWEQDNQDIEEGYPIAYVLTEDDYSNEFGSIGVKSVNGGLARTA